MATRMVFLLFVALIGSALAVVSSQHKARKLYLDLQKEQAAAKQLEIEWGQLQLEQGTWSTHARIEKFAVSRLGMMAPPPGRIEIVWLPQKDTP